MESDDGQAKNSFTNLAPRPWKSFKSEETEVMVVQKRTRISIPTRVNLENGSTGKESDMVDEGGISKTPTDEPELEKISAEGKEEKEDEVDDAGVNRRPVEEQKSGFNPFDSDEDEEAVGGLWTVDCDKTVGVGVRRSKKRKAPQPPPVKEVSTSFDNIQGDSVKSENDSEVSVKVTSNSEEGEVGDTGENSKDKIAEIHPEETTEVKEEEITERRETVLHNDNTVCEEQKVELRKTPKVIDMTIRTSTIQDLDEEDVLQEISDEEKTDEDTKKESDDEIDHEKSKELVLNVDTLEHNEDKEEAPEEKTEQSETEFKRVESGRISIRHGWSSFMRGIPYEISKDPASNHILH